MTHLEHITPIVKVNLKLNVKIKFMWLSNAYILVSAIIVISNTGTATIPENSKNTINWK